MEVGSSLWRAPDPLTLGGFRGTLPLERPHLVLGRPRVRQSLNRSRTGDQTINSDLYSTGPGPDLGPGPDPGPSTGPARPH